MKDFLDKCIAFATAHMELTAILAITLLLIIFVVIALIVSGAKRKKKKKLALEMAQKTVESTEQPVEKPVEEPVIVPVQEPTVKAQEIAPTKAQKNVVPKKAEEKVTAEKKVTEKPATKKTTSKPTEKPAVKKAQPKKENIFDELKDVEEHDAIFEEKGEIDKMARYSGKWVICRVVTQDDAEEEMYFFELRANNGEKLLSSEEYTSYAGALRGIETHKTNIEKDNFKITLSKKGDYIFKLLSGKNMLLCMGEHYTSKARCESAIESTKRFAQTAVLDENVQDYVVKVPVEDDGDIEPPAEGYNGKWIISSAIAPDGEEVFYFELFANNGEKLLSSEEYTTYIGAVNGIHTHKTNIEKGNFRISLTKRGDYIYKLLNGNGQLLCLGEHYKTKRRCLNAVESVKRFAANSPMLTDQKHTTK